MALKTPLSNVTILASGSYYRWVLKIIESKICNFIKDEYD
jgi:hypothetical protein